jgi:hypothetical protein
MFAEINQLGFDGHHPKLGELFYINDQPFVIVRKIEDIQEVHPKLRCLYAGSVNYFEVSTD